MQSSVQLIQVHLTAQIGDDAPLVPLWGPLTHSLFNLPLIRAVGSSSFLLNVRLEWYTDIVELCGRATLVP